MNDDVEWLDVVDSEDRVIGKVTRREAHERSLLHRAVHIFVLNRRNELFLQKRALSKDENPGLWDTSAAGHVDSGEGYAACARRELEEELGLRENPALLFKIPACPETLWEHVEVFSCHTEQSIEINPLEISEGRFWRLREIENALTATPGEFTSTFHLIFRKYMKNKGV